MTPSRQSDIEYWKARSGVAEWRLRNVRDYCAGILAALHSDEPDASDLPTLEEALQDIESRADQLSEKEN